MTREQFIEDWAVAQIMPGPNVVNLSMMIGDRQFGLSGALAALAGIMAAPVYQVSPLMGSNIIIVVFAVVVVGGMASVWGSLLGAALLTALPQAMSCSSFARSAATRVSSKEPRSMPTPNAPSWSCWPTCCPRWWPRAGGCWCSRSSPKCSR